MDKQKQKPPGYARPTFNLRFCIFCGSPCAWRTDRHGRHYHACGACSVRVFIHSQAGYSGVQVLQELILRQTVQRFRALVHHRTMRATSPSPDGRARVPGTA